MIFLSKNSKTVGLFLATLALGFFGGYLARSFMFTQSFVFTEKQRKEILASSPISVEILENRALSNWRSYVSGSVKFIDDKVMIIEKGGVEVSLRLTALTKVEKTFPIINGVIREDQKAEIRDIKVGDSVDSAVSFPDKKAEAGRITIYED